MEEKKKNLETSTKQSPLLKNNFDECQDSLIAIKVDCKNHKV
jgi:hypothetical protein